MHTGGLILRELQAAWRALDGYAVHAPECPAAWAPRGRCDCGLTAARTHLQETAWAALLHYGTHARGCPAPAGACGCGLADARRGLAVILGAPGEPGDAPGRAGEGEGRPGGFGALRRLLEAQPTRLWSLHELARAADLSLTDAKLAVEALAGHGELVRKGGEHYARPALEAQAG